MKVRHKITLWITGAGVIAGLLFSLVVFREMLEQPYELLDSELKAMAVTLVRLIEEKQGQAGTVPADTLPIYGRRYWVRVYDHSRNIVYESELARFTALPLYNKGKGYNVRTYIPRKRIDLCQDRHGEVIFRVMVLNIGSSGSPYMVHIGRPMEDLEDEISDLVLTLVLGLAASTLLLVLISYIVAGRILKPVIIINSLAREINEETLDKRIPLGKNRDELYELSSSLNRMFDRLQYSFTWQKQFLASASHELKSPITILRLFMDEAVHRQDLPESFIQRLINQNNILFRMDRLVKNLLNLSALELKESLELEDFSLTDLIGSVLEDFTDVIAARKIRLEINLPENLRILGDKEKIRHVLINILDNAIRYNRERGEIKLGASETKDAVKLSLFNTGPGIPEDDLDKVFEQFYRVEKSRSFQYGGSGLGLTIVRRIVRLHNGSVNMESRPGTWARIRIILPKLHG